MVLGKLDNDTQKNEPGPLSYSIHKINSKWMKDLNVRQEAIKILEEKAGKNLFALGCSNFLTHLQRQRTQKQNELLGPHQNKRLLNSKGNNQQN